MKLLKAFIRTSRVDAVIRALEEARAPGVTISRVHGVGYGYDPLLFTLSPSEIKKTPEVAKVEVVAGDDQVDHLIGVLADAARTSCRGDGIIFVTPVERAIKIRTGIEGETALEHPASHQ